MKKSLLTAAVVAAFMSWGEAKATTDGPSGEETVLLQKQEGDAVAPERTAKFKGAKSIASGLGLRFSGYARIFTLYRAMADGNFYQDSDNINNSKGLTLPVNLSLDDGSTQPLLMLRIEGNPTAKTSFQIEASLNNYLLGNHTGIPDETDQGRWANIFAGFWLKGATVTDYGRFELTAGAGSIWEKMSPMTLWNFQYRDDMFERYPWDPAGLNWRRYEWYYNTGDIPRDQRWGNRGMQGFVLNATDLPLGLEAKLLYGKTRDSGGDQNWSNGIPQSMLGARVSRQFGRLNVGGNYYNSFGFDETQSITRDNYSTIYGSLLSDEDAAKTFTIENYNRNAQTVITGDASLNTNFARFYGEFGAGSYLSRTYYDWTMFEGAEDGQVFDGFKRQWSPLAYMEAAIKKPLLRGRWKVAGYAIGQHAVNNQSTFLNSSIEEVLKGANTSNYEGEAKWNNIFYDGMITEIGQLTNNRWGAEMTHKREHGKLIVEASWAMNQEVVNHGTTERKEDMLNGIFGKSYTAPDQSNILESSGNYYLDGTRNVISFSHIVNQYQRSRFSYNQRFNGPNQRLLYDYRRTWQNVAILDTVVDYRKSFNTLELSLKYKVNFLGRGLIITGFGRANSVGDRLSPIPSFNAQGDHTFLTQWYEELMLFYNIHRKVTLIGLVATEQVRGNNERTEQWDPDTDAPAVDANGKPILVDGGKAIKQNGLGLGIGLDYDFANNACLDVRYRWYKHEDKHFTNDKFQGQEVTCELKIFF